MDQRQSLPLDHKLTHKMYRIAFQPGTYIRLMQDGRAVFLFTGIGFGGRCQNGKDGQIILNPVGPGNPGFPASFGLDDMTVPDQP